MYIRVYKTRNKNNTVREYLQIVETKRVERKNYPVQRLLLNVARIDNMDKKKREMLFNLARGILRVLGKEVEDIGDVSGIRKVGEKSYWGLLSISLGAWNLLRLDKMLQKIEKNKRIQFSLERVIFGIVVGRLYGRISESAVSRWMEKLHHSFGFKDIGLHHLYRGLDILALEWDKIEGWLKGRVLDLFHQEAEVLFIDTTSLIYWGKGDNNLTRRGFSKEKRSDKKQVVIGIALMNGIPIGIEVEPGNTADVEVMRKMINRFRERFNFKKVCIVADAGMVRVKDIDYYREKRWKYLVRARASEIIVKEKVKEAREDGVEWEEIEEGTWAKRFTLKSKDEKEWLIVVRNEVEEKYDRKVRESIIEQLREKEGREIKGIIHNKGYKKYLNSGGKIEINEKKIKESKIWDGIWVVRTNEEFKDLRVAVDRYKDLWMVERAFRDLKNLLDIRPIGHSTDVRIRGHIYACFLSLLVGFIIRKEIKDMEVNMPYEEVIGELKDLRIEWIEINKKRFLLRDELNEWQRKLFKRLKVPIPSSVLETS